MPSPGLLRKPLRIFLQAGHRDLGWDKPGGGTGFLATSACAAALAEWGYDFRLVLGDGGHSPNHGGVLSPTPFAGSGARTMGDPDDPPLIFPGHIVGRSRLLAGRVAVGYFGALNVAASVLNPKPVHERTRRDRGILRSRWPQTYLVTQGRSVTDIILPEAGILYRASHEMGDVLSFPLPIMSVRVSGVEPVIMLAHEPAFGATAGTPDGRRAPAGFLTVIWTRNCERGSLPAFDVRHLGRRQRNVLGRAVAASWWNWSASLVGRAAGDSPASHGDARASVALRERNWVGLRWERPGLRPGSALLPKELIDDLVGLAGRPGRRRGLWYR